MKVVELYKKAAYLGSSSAMNNLANFYVKGESIEKNYLRAAELYQKSADLGNSNAMYHLISCY